MICYKDKCYCFRSYEHWCKENNIPICTNTECYRHCAEIPWDELPEYMGVSLSDFGEKCGEYKGE